MKRYHIYIGLLLVLVACTNEQTEVKLDQADAVYKTIEQEFSLSADGSIEQRFLKKQTLLTHRAFHSLYGETRVVYNPDFETIEVIKSNTIMADGRVVASPENAIVELLPGTVSGSQEFDHLREKVIVHTGLDIGATIQTEYIRRIKPGFLPALMADVLINQDCPIENYILKVGIPKDMDLDYHLINLDLEPTIQVKAGKKIYSWKLKGLEQATGEKQGIQTDLTAKHIVFSSEANFFNLFNDFTSQRAFTFETNEDMRHQLALSVHPGMTELEKIYKAHQVVAQNMKTISVPLALNGYIIRPAIPSWESMVGTLAEKAVVLTAFLRSLGFEAKPVAAIPSFYVDSLAGELATGTLDLLDFQLISIPFQGKNLYINVGSELLGDAAFNYPNYYFIPLEMGYSKVNLEYNGQQNFQLSWDGTFQIVEGNLLAGHADLQLLGGYNHFIAMSAGTDMTKQYFKYGNSETSSTTKSGSDLGYDFMTDEFSQVQGDYRVFKLPFLPSGMENIAKGLLSPKRQSVLFLPGSIRELQRFSIRIPSGYVVVSEEQSVLLKNTLGNVNIKHSFSEDEVIIQHSLTIQDPSIEPGQYQEFVALMNEWLSERYQTLVFRKK